jgi:WD40 repeat protein/tRNA A-37 threonylcarbamoyl transferase component Bud32
MGIVYEARHKDLNRRVAIKMLRGAALADPEFHERFRAEAEAIARLQHPNIIQVFEVGTVDAEPDETPHGPFIALEFVDGGSLTQHTYTPQPPREAARLVETLARAAHAAHKLGIVHRDLKPANVLLTRDGVPKIADFGIAKQINTERAEDRFLTRAGTVMGTPEYMAPEHLRGRSSAPAIDIYALGVILYELLTARVPFQGATHADTMVLVLRQEPVPPRRLQPNIPRDLETICLKCLEKSPAKRYASAEALADDLAHWAQGRAIQARPVGAVGRTVGWARRNPAVAVLSLAVLLIAVTGVAGIVWQWNDARTNAAESQENARKAEAAAADAREAAEKERWERYRVSVYAASSALRLHDTTGARRGLEAAPENHREWVWHLLDAQLDRSRAVLAVGDGPISRAQFTRDGRRMMARQRDAVIRVWDLPTRTEYRPSEPLPPGQHFRFSPDGSTIAQSPDEREIQLYDLAPQRFRAALKGHTDQLQMLEYSPDGARLFSFALDRTLRTWDVRSGTALRTTHLPKGVGYPLRVSPNGRFFASGWNGTNVPRLWDAETGRELARLDGHEGRVRTMRFAPSGNRLVTIGEYPTNVMRVWEVPSGKLLATLPGHENQVSHVDFSPDESRLASCSPDRTVRLWDLSKPLTGAVLPAHRVLRGHTGRVEHVTFSPDGRRVVSAAYDRTLRYWDAESGELVAVLQGHTDWVGEAAFCAERNEIYSVAHDGTVRVWDVGELEADYAIRGHTKFVYGVACHPDGVRIASAAWDGSARIWNASTRRELLALVHTGPTDESRIVTAVAYHPSGRYLATLARDDSARLWDGETGKELYRWPIPTRHWSDSRLAFSPRGDLLAAGSHDGCVRLWDVNTRAEVGVLSKHDAPIRDVAFSPDGALLASAGENGDRTVRIWNVATRSEVAVLRAHTDCVYAIGWNRAGTLLASGSVDGTVRVWEVPSAKPEGFSATWREVGAPMRQGTSAYAVAFTHDGKLLAVGCADNQIRIWDMATQRQLAELSGHTDYVHALAFSPDGTRLVSGSGDHSVRVWDTIPASARGQR